LLKDEVLIVNPNDIFENTAYTALLAGHKKKDCILYYRLQSKKLFSWWLSGGKRTGAAHPYSGETRSGKEPSDMVNILVHLHADPETLLHYISQVKTNDDDVYERAIDAMCKDHLAIQVVPYTGAWTPIKYPWHVLDACPVFLDQAETKISSDVRISSHAVLDGKVILEDGVRVWKMQLSAGRCISGEYYYRK